MIDDFGLAVEEVERTRMMSQIGLTEIRSTYQRERATFDAEGDEGESEHDVQVFWQRSELAAAEIERDYPAITPRP